MPITPAIAPRLAAAGRSVLLLGIAVGARLIGMEPDATALSAHAPMPVPAEMHSAGGRLQVPFDIPFSVQGAGDARLTAAVDRMLHRWSVRTGAKFAARPSGVGEALLVLECKQASAPVPHLNDDETYTLAISPRQAVLSAPTTVGVLRGLATLTQLLTQEGGMYFLPASEISDRPRFAWRGLMIDVVRHWQPYDVVRRQLDAMELVKLNVLHLHLTDDQGFRIESRTHPELHAQGSDGQYFTQKEISELLACAHARGIRIVPEFDLPSHATSWTVSHPELASAPGPHVLYRRWGTFAALDPTNEALYPLLDDFLGEMAGLFPDDYLHIGGDENDGVQWNANPRIREFIGKHGLGGCEGLQAWFNRRLGEIILRHGKRLVGWDEILHPDLPRDDVIQTWRGPEGLLAAVRTGHPVILSHGYYLNNCNTSSAYYLNDPLPAGTQVPVDRQALVLGGEAAIWGEWVTPDNIDTRIWPSAAAIAERLWSPRSVIDSDDMYRRLEIMETRLRETGVLATPWPRIRLPGVDPEGPVARALITLAAALETAKSAHREDLQPDVDQTVPLDELADWVLPENRRARRFNERLEQWLMAEGPLSAARAAPFAEQFEEWRAAGKLAAQAPAGPGPREQGRAQIARSLQELGSAGAEAIAALLAGKPRSPEWLEAATRAIAGAGPNAAAVEFPFLPSLRLLLNAAGNPAMRSSLPRETWRARVLESAKSSSH